MVAAPYGNSYNTTQISGPGLSAQQGGLGSSGIFGALGATAALARPKGEFMTEINNVSNGRVGSQYAFGAKPQGPLSTPAPGTTAPAAPAGLTPEQAAMPLDSTTAPTSAISAAPGATAAEATAPGAAGVGDAASLSSGAGATVGDTAGSAGAGIAGDTAATGGATIGSGIASVGSGIGPGMMAGMASGYLTGKGGTEKSQIGSAVGTVAGSIIGAYFGVPMLGGMAGGALGGLFADGGSTHRPAGQHPVGPLSQGMIGNASSMNGNHPSVHGRISGPGDGRSDSIAAQLSSGEYVLPADVVSAMGNGSNDAGSDRLDQHVMQTRSQQMQHLQSLPPPRGAQQHLAYGGQVGPMDSPEAFGMSLMNSQYR